MQKNEEIENALNNDIKDDVVEEKISEVIDENVESTDKLENKKTEVNTETPEQEKTVIEKIKDFISKIIAMQEEASKELMEDEGNGEQTSEVQSPSGYMLEYYDLPYRYNETIVKILAQTPKKLYVYWDISDNDRNKYIESFGNDFFNITYPVLLLYNEDRKYVKEVPINDFANSWYIDIEDAKTKYTIQLGRKFKNKPEIINLTKFQENNIILKTDYLPFADSNSLEAPNDHVLLEYLPEMLTFRNVKTNEEFTRKLKDLKDAFGNNYDVKDFYGDMYKEELDDGMFDMKNPSSRLSSSAFK